MKIFSKIKAESSQFGVPWWELPDFLLVFMAIVNIVVMLVSYKLYSAFEEDPRYVIALVAAEAILVMVIGNMIVEASKKVVAVNKLKREFIEISSHQMRGPLSTIKWYVEMLLRSKKGTLNKKQKEFVQTINDANSRMLSVVNDLLNVSHIESGSNNLMLRRINIVEVINQVISGSSSLAAAKNIRLSFKQSGKKIFAKADPEKMKIILENIIGNAIKYTDEEGSVEMAIEKTSNGVVCKISDNGIGIDEDETPFIFQKFYRAKKTRTRNVVGTGLGLYICKALVGQMKGNIWFESRNNKGTTFFINLPSA